MPNNNKGFTHVVLFVVVAILLVGVVLLSNLKPQAPNRSGAAATPRPLNVLDLRYFPVDTTVQQAKVNALVPSLKAAIEEASKAKGYKNASATPYVQVNIKRTVERFKSSPNTSGNSTGSLKTALNSDGENLCDYIASNNIDQVWLWIDVRNPHVDTGAYSDEHTQEWSNFLKHEQGTNTLCGGRRTFLVLGLDQNRQVAEALHSFGHALELTVPDFQGYDLFWTKWAGSVDSSNTLAHTCGDVHFPPNGTIGDGLGYDYDNSTPISSKCENWKPDGTGTATSLTCSRWNCSQDGFIKWWLQNVPNQGNGLTYNGRILPNWWDLITDVDNGVINANNSNFYMVPAYDDFARPSYVDNVSLAPVVVSGNQYTWSHKVSGTNRLLVVSASYRSPSSVDTDKLSGVWFNNTFFTPLEYKRNGQYVTEIWYLKNPPVGTFNLLAQIQGNVADLALSGTSFVGVDQTTPIVSSTSNMGTSKTPSLTTNVGTGNVALGVLSMYIGNNEISRSGGTIGLWESKSTNVISKGGVVPSGANATLSWNATTSWPWAISAAVIHTTNVTPPPTTPTVDLKVAGVNGPITVSYNATVHLTWSSTNATSCTASGGWTGAQPVNGAADSDNLTANTTFTLNCNGATDTVTVNVTPTPPPTTPSVDLQVMSVHDTSGVWSNGPYLAIYGDSLKLKWTGVNITSCIVPDYAVEPGSSGQGIGLTPVKLAKVYTISCTTTTGTTVKDNVSVTIPTARVDLKANANDNLATGIGTSTSLKFTWTSSVVTSCVASSAVSGVSGTPTYWNGSKAVTGNYTLTTNEFNAVKAAVIGSKPAFYDILCTGATGKAYDTLQYSPKPQRAF